MRPLSPAHTPLPPPAMLLTCVAYEDGRKVADLPLADISEHLSKPGRFVWVALHDATAEELEALRVEFDLHELAVEDARNGHQRPKIEEYGDTVFAVVRTIELGEDNALLVGEVDVFAGPNFAISVRNHSEHSLADVRARAEREPHLLRYGSGFVLYALIDAIVDQYFPVIEHFEAELDAIEEQIFATGTGRVNVERLYDLKRRSTLLKHAVAPLLESVGHLTQGRVPSVCEPTRDYFRDVLDHLARINALLDTLRETIAMAVQVNLSMVTIEEAETSKRLAAWAGIFALATVFAGIWGMNFTHMPELGWAWGYPAALITMAVSCAALYRYFRKLGWL